jgi:hypothetical protein
MVIIFLGHYAPLSLGIGHRVKFKVPGSRFQVLTDFRGISNLKL